MELPLSLPPLLQTREAAMKNSLCTGAGSSQCVEGLSSLLHRALLQA